MTIKKSPKVKIKKSVIRMPMDLWDLIQEIAFKNKTSANAVMLEQIKKIKKDKKDVA